MHEKKKSLVSKKNKRFLRLKCVEEFINNDHSFWSAVLFTDESKFGSDDRKIVWRTKRY